MKETTTIQISKELAEILRAKAKKGETYEEIITKLVEYTEMHEKNLVRRMV